jgi:hypothetical protein
MKKWEQKQKTKVSKSLTPVWNASFTLKLPVTGDITCAIKVWDKRKGFSTESCHAVVSINLEGGFDDEGWFRAQQGKGKFLSKDQLFPLCII